MSRRSATAERRRAILDAALSAFERGGLAGITIGALSEASGASVGSIYHHFGDRAGVVAALYRESLALGLDELLAALRVAPDTESGVRALVATWLAWVGAHPVRARLIYDASGSDLLAPHADEIAAFKNAFYERVAAWTSARTARGELRPLPVWALDPVVMGPAHEFARRWLLGLPVPLEQATPFIAEAVWRSVAPEDSAR